MSPAAVVIRTAVRPGPLLVFRVTGTCSLECSQVASNSADGLLRSASTMRRADLGRVLVQRRGQQGAPRGQPGPAQVGVTGGVVLGSRLQGGQRAGGRGGIGQPPERELSEFVGGLVGRGLARPPDHHRGVRQQQGPDHRGRVGGDRTPHPDDHHLARGALTDPDLGIQRGGPAAAGDHQQDAGRVLPAGLHAGRERVLVLRFLADHDQGEHHALGGAAGRPPGPEQRRGDLGRGGLIQRDDH